MAMITLTCPHCGFSKDLGNITAPPDGTKVTCPKCRGSFAFSQRQPEISSVPGGDAASVCPLADNRSQAPVQPKPLSPPASRQKDPRELHADYAEQGKSIGFTTGVVLAAGHLSLAIVAFLALLLSFESIVGLLYLLFLFIDAPLVLALPTELFDVFGAASPLIQFGIIGSAFWFAIPWLIDRAVTKFSAHKTRPVRIKAIMVIIPLMLVGFVCLGLFAADTSVRRSVQVTPSGKGENWQELETITAEEKPERDGILSQSESLLLAADYDGLEKNADKYRSGKEMFQDGEWKLSVFYDGMSYYLRQAPEDSWVSRLDKLRNWVSVKPNSITARVALAECLVGYAFHGRSGAYAKDVGEEQFRRFTERLKEASEVLDQAESLPQKCPGWWAAYQRIALGGGWDRARYDKFMESAIAFEPTYNVYYYRTAWHLLPWWFGADGDWEEFAKSAADRVGGPNGDILYTRIVWFMDRRVPKNVVDKNSELMWQRVNNGIQLIKGLKTK